MEADNRDLIFDCGSYHFRAGNAGDDSPIVKFRTVVGRPKAHTFSSDEFLGDEAIAKRGILKLNFPAENHPIKDTDWNDMLQLYKHAFYNEIHADPKQCRVLMSDRLPINLLQRERKAQNLFQGLNLSALRIENENFLAMLSTGRSSGLVVDMGYKSTRAAVFCDSKIVDKSVVSVPIGGYHVTEKLNKLFFAKGVNFSTAAQRDLLDDIKHKHCNFPDFKKKNIPEIYELPDGAALDVGGQTREAPQLIFQPKLIDLQVPGLHQIIRDSLNYVKKANNDQLVLSGGGSCILGLEGRLQSELLKREIGIKIIASPERIEGTWIGGSILASLTAINERWVTKAMYDQIGPSVMQRQKQLMFSS